MKEGRAEGREDFIGEGSERLRSEIVRVNGAVSRSPH